MKRNNKISVLVLAIAASACNNDAPGATTSGSSTGTTAATADSDSTTAACVGSPDVVGECAVECQDCPPSERCVISRGSEGKFDQTSCRPLPEDPKEPGESCAALSDDPYDSDDDCQRGSTCMSFPLFPDSRCLSYCRGVEGEPACADSSTRCMDFYGNPICAPVCDPREQGECEWGCRPVDVNCPGCFPMTDSGTFTCWYPPPEEGVFGSPCPFGECHRTFFCGPPGRVPGCDADTPCCTEYCSTAQPSCPEGTACEAVFAMGQAPQGLEDLGACLTPS